METRDEQANIANALVIASKSTRTIALGPTITSFLEQVTLQEPILNQPITPLMHFALKLTPIVSQGFDISDLLSFDPASMGMTTPGAKVPTPQQSANLADQLQLIKGLLSAPISTLVDDSREIQKILEQIESQLPESLRVKLWPAGHLPFFRAEVKAAQQRIELRHS